MHLALTLYTICQSLLFIIFLFSQRKSGNKHLVLYFIYLVLTEVSGLVTSDYWPSLSKNEFLKTTYELIILCRPAVVFHFLYSLLERPAPKVFQWLWLLPLLNLGIHYSFKIAGIDLYEINFYEQWYLSVAMYVRVLFLLLLIWQLKVFNQEIKDNSIFKQHHQILKLYWGNYFIYFNLGLLCFSLLYLAATLANGRIYTIRSDLFDYSQEIYNLIYESFTSIFLFIFGYMALRNASVLNSSSSGFGIEHRVMELVLPEEEKKLQNKSELTEAEIERYTLILTQLLEKDKVYLDPDLSLGRLAKLSGIPPRILSRVIQLAFHKKYVEYITDYRIMHAKKLLDEQQNSRSIMYSISMESGFHSESSFYTLFKQYTGLTPKQYRDKLRNKS